MGRDRSYTNMDLTSIGGRDLRSTTCALPNITVGTKNYAQTGYPNGTPGSLAANVAGPYGALNPVTNGLGPNCCRHQRRYVHFPAVRPGCLDRSTSISHPAFFCVIGAFRLRHHRRDSVPQTTEFCPPG